ncbi:sulfotransferase 1E1-like isoform X2 [Crassostrea angulata]|nr:sulfotransferase 1E1-like isoform X2 [Crassostrea angulata]
MEETSKPKPTGPVVFDGMVVPPFPPLLQDAGKRFEEIKNMECRKDDVIVVTYPKSGTHWAWEIVTMLLKQRAEYSKEPMECFFLEAMPDFNFVHNVPSPRIFNTHIPIRWFPNQHIENGAKIVHVLRNPKDIAVSMYHHFKNVGMLGDVENFQIFLEKMFMNPKAQVMDGWFKFEKDFEKAKKNDELGAIITVHYESLKKNPIQETKRLAEYLNVELSKEEITEISDKCSFKKLKLASQTVKDNSLVANVELFKKTEPFVHRKGEIGDWKNHFTVAMNENFDAIFKEEMKNSNIQVQFE